MAEGGVKTILCRYFVNGVCRDGERCKFSHNRDTTRPSLVCRYYLRGACAYGQNCRYDHAHPERHEGRQKVEEIKVQSSQPNPITLSVVNKESIPLSVPHSLTISNNIYSNNSMSTYNTTSSILSSSSNKNKNSIMNSLNPTTNHYNLPVSFNGKTLKNGLSLSSGLHNLSWAEAPEFVPKLTKDKSWDVPDVSYATAAGAGDLIPNGSLGHSSIRGSVGSNAAGGCSDSELCPTYLMSGLCQLEDSCPYVHGDFCEVCQLACLHPQDQAQRDKHKEECTKLMEAEMEHSFAVARSREKVCGICMDTIMERSLASQRRFGVLPNCNHCFCLNCIRKWRQSKQFENKIIRSCPECRTQSDFVIPSRYWVDDKEKEDKDKLIDSYQQALSDKACKYFKQGEGQCPFGNKCFYLHAMPDGTKKDVGPPRRRRRFGPDGELQLYMDNMVLWDFIEEREHRLELLRGSIQTLLLELELEDLADDLYFMDDSSVSETEQ